MSDNNEDKKDPSKANNPNDSHDDDGDKKPAATETKVQDERNTVQEDEATQQPFTPSILYTPSVAAASYSKFFVSSV